MSYLKTAEQWWQLLEANKKVIRGMVAIYHPVTIRNNIAQTEAKISAPAAEAACEVIRQKIIEDWQGDLPTIAFDKALESKDGPAMDRLLQATWFCLPESMSSRELPGFQILCDLCREDYLVCEEENGAS